jgi:hypothetical protein
MRQPNKYLDSFLGPDGVVKDEPGAEPRPRPVVASFEFSATDPPIKSRIGGLQSDPGLEGF